MYARFRDDSFILHSGRHQFRQWYGKIKALCRQTFEPEVVEVSRDGVTMLDVTVRMHVKGFQFFPRFQESQGPPLSTSSAHPSRVHCWPIARLKVIRELCSSEDLFNTACEIFFRRFEAHYAPRSLLAALRKERARIIRGDAVIRKHSRDGDPSQDVMRLVLDWHPAWENDQRLKKSCVSIDPVRTQRWHTAKRGVGQNHLESNQCGELLRGDCFTWCRDQRQWDMGTRECDNSRTAR